MTKPYNGGKPTFHEFITPIGLCVFSYHDEPQLKFKDQNNTQPDMDEKTGLQHAEYKVTLAWNKSSQNQLSDLIQLAQKVKHEGWPESANPQAFFALQPFFRDGDNPDHNTAGKDFLRGKYYLNFKSKADAKRDQITGRPVYSGAPGLIGPNKEDLMPTDWYSGCQGRVSGIMFATEYMGKHFISVRLNNIQKFSDGERIGGGGKPDAKDQFDSIDGANSATFDGLKGLL